MFQIPLHQTQRLLSSLADWTLLPELLSGMESNQSVKSNGGGKTNATNVTRRAAMLL